MTHHRGRATGRLARLTASLGAAVVALGVLGLVAAPTASAADNGTWSVFPTQAENSGPRNAFSFQVAAGSSLTDSVTIRNNGQEVLRLELYAADAFNATGGGGFALRQQGQASTGLGSWVKLGRSVVTLAPGRQALVPFTMTVPINATPGDHAGGIVAVNAQPEGVEQAEGGVSIGIKRAVGTRIYTRVQGPLTPSLSVTDVTIDVTDKASIPLLQEGRARITYTVVNTGNTRISADQAVRITGLFGQTLAEPSVARAPELLPGQTMTLALDWDSVPAFNQANLRVELVSSEGNVAAAGDATVWLVPWLFLLVVVALAILTWLIVALSRRNRRPSSEQPGPGSPFPTLSTGANGATAGHHRSTGTRRKG